MQLLKGRYVLTIILFIIGAFCGFFLNQLFQKTSNNGSTSNGSCQYKYLNPIRCDTTQAVKKQEYVGLQNEIAEYIDRQKKNGLVSTVSVYFRDLENGPTMGINGQELFAPASLLKLPLMIAFYQKAQTDPAMLQKKISIPADMKALEQNIIPGQTVEKGKDYSINDLITMLITQSDNISGQLLLTYLNKNYPGEDFIFTLNDLGIIDPRKSIDEQYISVASYGSIFRVLYNSSYLNMDMSDKALALLSKTEFKEGLVAGIPNEIQVAHKFGERRNDNDQQLHDCGIVYYTANPYLLCIMTRGKNLLELEPVIQHISKRVYDEVKKRN